MGKVGRGQQGSATSTVLMMISFLIILLAGAFFFILSMFGIERRHLDRFEVRKALVAKANEVYTLLLEDESPEVDHLFDEARVFADEHDDVELNDISSYLNPNWIDRKMLEHLNENMLGAGNTLMDGSDGLVLDNFINFREKYGPLSNIGQSYGEFFNEEYFDDYFTEYNYFNFNITYQYVFRGLYSIRMNQEDIGQSFVEKYQNYLNDLARRWQNNANAPLIKALGLEHWFLSNDFSLSDFELMFPVLNAEPVMNLHYVPEEILRGILSYEAYHVNDVDTKIEKLVKQREENQNGLTERTFDTILGSTVKAQYPSNRIYHYFGFITWFWELKVNVDGSELRWIIARVPPRKFGDDAVYKLIKEEFSFADLGDTSPQILPDDADAEPEAFDDTADDTFEEDLFPEFTDDAQQEPDTVHYED